MTVKQNKSRIGCETPKLHGRPPKIKAELMSERIGIAETGDVLLSGSGDAVKLAEERFYSLYDWCLNPAQPLRELLQRFREELGRFRTVEFGWQRDECTINLYL